MSKALTLLKKVTKDEDGAALVEYTVLLGILLVAVIAAVVTMGTWISSKWSNLNASLSTH